MIIFKDLLSSDDSNYMDELCTSAEKPEEVEECPGFLRVAVKRVSRSTTINDAMFGGNASAEGEDAQDAAEDCVESGIDIVLNNHLVKYEYYYEKVQEVGKDKAFDLFKAEYFKPFCKTTLEKLAKCGCDEKAKEFKAAAPAQMKFLKKKFKDIDIYSGKTFDPGELKKHSFCFVTFGPDGMEDYMYFNKYALFEEKV